MTIQLIAQIGFIVFILIILIQTIRKRKLQKSNYHFWTTIISIIILSIWLYFAGAFNQIFNI